MTFLTPIAFADATPEEHALASALFKEAKTLLDDGRVPEACRKLEESQRLVPAGGTLLNLAVCHEREGKTASAWAELRQARVIAEKDGRTDRIDLIDERLRIIEPSLSTLVVVADDPSVEVKLDGLLVRPPAYGTSIPIDPGAHTIEATAAGKKPWNLRVDIAPTADRKTITIPVLVADDPPAVPVKETPTPIVEVAPPPPVPNRTPAFVIGAIGVGALLAGGVSGVIAFAKKDESEEACSTNPCGPASVALNDDAKVAADVSTIAFAIGAVSLGVATFLWFDAGPKRTGRFFRVGPGLVAGAF